MAHYNIEEAHHQIRHIYKITCISHLINLRVDLKYILKRKAHLVMHLKNTPLSMAFRSIFCMHLQKYKDKTK